MRIIAVAAVLVSLGGCATAPQVRTITHEVKIPMPCNPQMPARPVSSVDALPINAQIDEQMRALRADRQRAKAYANQLEQALVSCQTR